MIKITIVWKDSKHSANMGKDSNTNSKQSSKPRSRSKDQVKVNCILRFKESKPSDQQIKAKFYEADDTKVSEQIRKFKTGNDDTNLVGLMNEIVGLGNLYAMWEDGKSQKLSQTLSRALEGQVRTDWLEIIGVHEWDNDSKQNISFVCFKTLASRHSDPKLSRTNARQ